MLTLATLALALAAQGQDYSWSGTLAAGKDFTVKNISGDVTIEASSGRAVEIRAVKRRGRRGDPEDVMIRRLDTADGIEVCVIYRGMNDNDDDCDMNDNRRDRRDRDRWRNDTSVDFTIRLPASIILHATTVSGDVSVSGLRAEVEATSVSGDVAVRNVTGQVVEAQTVSGNVDLIGVSAREVSGETVSGSVTYSGSMTSNGEYNLKTLSGDVVVSVPANTGADVDASTFSGSFTSALPFARDGDSRESRRWTRRHISGTLGSGGARLDLTSFSGDVEIRELRGN